MRKVSAGERRIGGPRRAEPEVRAETLERELGEAPIGGDLSAVDREQRCLPGAAIEIEHVLAREILGTARAVIEQLAHARVGVHDLVGRYRIAEIDAGGGAEISDLGCASGRR